MWSKDKVLASDRQWIWHPYTQEKIYHEKRPPLVIREAEGPWLIGDDGQKILDGNASWWVQLYGHRHPKLLKAMMDQMNQMPHIAMAGMIHEPAVRCAQKLIENSTPNLTRVFFSDNGSSAVEVALRMSYQYWRLRGETKRNSFASLDGGFHGDTLGAVAVGGFSTFHGLLEPLLPKRIALPFPFEQDFEALWMKTEELIVQHAEELSAVVVEPLVQGASGMRMYPSEYLKRLRALTKEQNIHLILDEVFTGLGRTGRFWASQYAEIEGDFLCTSKALGGGLVPFAATLSSEEVYNAFYGEQKDAFYYGHTFTGYATGCAIACQAIELSLEALQTIEPRSHSLSQYLEIFRDLPGLKEIRQLGMIAAIEFEGEGYLDDLGWKIYDEGLKRGLYARPLGSVIYLLPPLESDESLLQQFTERLHEAARAVLKPS